jgi:uncharacterized lipoprotein YmbA
MPLKSSINHSIAAAVVLAGWLLAGCSAVGGSTVRYYTINPAAYAGLNAPPGKPLALEILNLHVPEYLERSHIVIRNGASMNYSEFNLWAENLRKNLMRTLARNLGALLSTPAISTPFSRSSAEPDFRLEVHIDQFELDSDELVRLAARWQLIDAETSKPLGVHSVDLQGETPIAAGEYERMAEEMGDMFGRLCELIAKDIEAAAGETGEQ